MLDSTDIERLKEIFVTRDECRNDMTQVETRQSESEKQLAVINTKLSLILWLLGAVGGAVIAVLVKLLFGG